MATTTGPDKSKAVAAQSGAAVPASQHGALEGIRVLDWTVWQVGAAASVMLADMGAEVIKIEEPRRGDPGRGLVRARTKQQILATGASAGFEGHNRNKKGIAVDLGNEKGREIVYRLASKSDVFVHNHSAGAAQKLGMDYASLCRVNNRLIYGSASAFGLTGPDKDESGYDYIGQAASGMLAANGEPGSHPIWRQGGTADQIAGTTLALGVITALLVRERTGIGQEVHASILGSLLWVQSNEIMSVLLTGETVPKQARSRATNPMWCHYRCADGKWIAFGNYASDPYWPALCNLLGRSDLATDPRYDNADKRAEHCEHLVATLGEIFAQKPRDAWVQLLKGKSGLICYPVQDHFEVVQNPQVLENRYVVDFDHPVLGHVKELGFPIHFSRTGFSLRLPAPTMGQHTAEVLSEIAGYSQDEIAGLKKEGIVR